MFWTKFSIKKGFIHFFNRMYRVTKIILLLIHSFMQNTVRYECSTHVVNEVKTAVHLEENYSNTWERVEKEMYFKNEQLRIRKE